MIEIVYSHPDFYICKKDSGIDFHSDQGQLGFFATLAQQVKDEKIYPVHRLDKSTSGLMIVARSKESARDFGELFSSSDGKKIEKYYLGISSKKPIKKQGTIKGDMERSRRSTWKLLRRQENPGITSFFSISWPLVLGNKPLKGTRLCLFKIYTGKTHQIRVAMKSLGAPLLGDPLYGEPCVRLSLHSYALRFYWKGENYFFRDFPSNEPFFCENLDSFPPEWESLEDLRWPLD